MRHVRLRTLALRDFRNVARAELALPPEGIAVVGENGQGKTSLLEAVAYLHLLRSVRGARDRELVRFDAPAFHVQAEVEGGVVGRVGAGADRSGAKKVVLDGVEQARLAEALGALPSVFVAPRDVVLVEGGPGERRRFLDIVLALTSPSYLEALRRYRAALARRNAALREAGRRGRGGQAGEVAAWEPALAEHGATLVAARRAWAHANAAEFARLCTAIGERGEAALAYDSPFAAAVDARGALAEALARQRDHDARRGLTHAGPHRDDLGLTLDGRDLRAVGSAGQARTAAIALRLLELRTYVERTGAHPLLLLDDPFAELDRRRAERVLALLDAADAGQVLLCVPRADEVPPHYARLARWRVHEGVFTPEARAAAVPGIGLAAVPTADVTAAVVRA